MSRPRKKLPFKQVKELTISFLSKLEKEEICLEDLVIIIYNKILESGRSANSKTTSSVQKRYGATISRIAQNIGWTTYVKKHGIYPKTYLRRIPNVYKIKI